MFLFGGREQRVELRMKLGWWRHKFSPFCCDVGLATECVGTCVLFRKLREVLSVSAETTTADSVDLKLVDFLPDGLLIIFLHRPQG